MPRLGLLAIPAVRMAVAAELGREIEFHTTIGSTQTRARELAVAGLGRAIVIADEQSSGMGTRERVWLSPPGAGLLASWVLRPAPQAPALYAALAGVAVVRALDRLGIADATLKWPNDVELGGRKLAGALAHGTSDGRGGLLVLGIGINVHQRPTDHPADLQGRAISLAATGRTVDRLALLARLSRELDRLEDRSETAAAMDEWRARCSLIGEMVAAHRPDGTAVRGTATGIDDDGALLVRTSAGVERVITGDVTRE